jgi:tetratricopeptide (TPR) repeat protein
MGGFIACQGPLARLTFLPYRQMSKSFMPTLEEQYDDAMFAFGTGDYDAAITGLKVVLSQDPTFFDAQLALGMAYCRKGDYYAAIAEGHKAEKLRPNEQLVHTNLSLFYVKAGDKNTAEAHGLKARISSWKDNMAPPDSSAAPPDSGLSMAAPKPENVKLPARSSDTVQEKDPSDH